MVVMMSGILLLLTPAPEPASDHHHHKYQGTTLMLVLIIVTITLFVGLMFHEHRKKSAAAAAATASSKGHQELLEREHLDSGHAHDSGHAQTTLETKQAPSLEVSMPPYVTALDHQHQDNDPLSLSKYSYKSSTFNSRNMVTLQEGWPIFNMDELLRCSARPLYGQGVFGTAYKVTHTSLPNVMIRHLKDVSISYQEFGSRLGDLAKLDHVNVLPIVAYYFSESEKILLYEYLGSGNLSVHLHGKGTARWAPLDWPKRAQIALDVARGIAYIHGKGRNKGLTHGNIKPSNVLLRGDGPNEKACLVDTGLSHLLRACPQSLNMGYRAPEVMTHTNRLFTHKADVFSFGVLLLELITAKQPFPPNAKAVLDLPRLIQSSIQREWTAEIFDPNIPHSVRYEEEIVLMLKIAMDCVRLAPRERPSMAKVVGMIKLTREFGDIPGSTYTDTSENLDPDFV
ncbi:hypothetical protein GOP47_0000450 [Adiantum capillus-veneris]|uniref:Protein kinase domain-containing protein n=1 Tax=Adiantum capillus-veneris TaxID=13818 RepID=A0A9D4ZSC2_ADICA|nr:hypothetical protein GOP47_0000450 [Adiantum capillus-veneris]